MKTSGYSLLECVIALTLSVLLLQAVILFYLNFNRQLTQVAQRYCELSAVESFAQWFRYSIENAGFRGCRRLSTAPSVLSLGTWSLTSANALQTTEKSWQTHFADPQSAKAVLAITNAQVISLKSTQGFAIGDKVLIADCTNAEINRIANISDEKLGLIQPLKLTYSKAEIFLYREETYYLNASRLYRREAEGRAMTLLNHIADLHLSLKEDGVAARVRFQCQTEVATWHFWQAVRL